MNLFETAKKQMMICLHRGMCGGNIPGNTIAAFEIALRYGVDMLELDITKSADDELFVFHPGTEKRWLRKDISLREMEAAEIKKLRWVNSDGNVTEHPIYTFDEVLEQFKGRAFLNIDKFADCPSLIIDKIKAHGMEEQCLVKCVEKESVTSLLEEKGKDIPFLCVTRDAEAHDRFMKRKINYAGLEMIFGDDTSPLASREFVDKLHSDGKLAYGNSILFSYTRLLSGMHSDDTALCNNDMECGWGFFANNGYDIVQTDWAVQLKQYLIDTGKYYR